MPAQPTAGNQKVTARRRPGVHYLPGTAERRTRRGLNKPGVGHGSKSTIGQRIRAVRQRAGLEHARFATNLGYATRTIINWETGEAEPPVDILPKLRRQYDVDPEWIVSGEDLVPVSEFRLHAIDDGAYQHVRAMVMSPRQIDTGTEAEQMTKRKQVETGFHLDDLDSPMVSPPDPHRLTYEPLYTSEARVLQDWLKCWAINPRFDLDSTCPGNLLTFANAIELAGCVLFAYRVEATAKAQVWNDAAHWIADDNEEHLLAEKVETVISAPEYAPFVELLMKRFSWRRDQVAACIASHGHEDHGMFFGSMASESWDSSAYGEYVEYCRDHEEKPLDETRWSLLRASASFQDNHPL